MKLILFLNIVTFFAFFIIGGIIDSHTIYKLNKARRAEQQPPKTNTDVNGDGIQVGDHSGNPHPAPSSPFLNAFGKRSSKSETKVEPEVNKQMTGSGALGVGGKDDDQQNESNLTKPTLPSIKNTNVNGERHHNGFIALPGVAGWGVH